MACVAQKILTKSVAWDSGALSMLCESKSIISLRRRALRVKRAAARGVKRACKLCRRDCRFPSPGETLRSGRVGHEIGVC